MAMAFDLVGKQHKYGAREIAPEASVLEQSLRAPHVVVEPPMMHKADRVKPTVIPGIDDCFRSTFTRCAATVLFSGTFVAVLP
jgi:hypothetical protein